MADFISMADLLAYHTLELLVRRKQLLKKKYWRIYPNQKFVIRHGRLKV